MARIENQPKVILTQGEIAILNETRKILTEIAIDDNSGYVYDNCDNGESEIWWIERFLEKLINISEVRKND